MSSRIGPGVYRGVLLQVDDVEPVGHGLPMVVPDFGWRSSSTSACSPVGDLGLVVCARRLTQVALLAGQRIDAGVDDRLEAAGRQPRCRSGAQRRAGMIATLTAALHDPCAMPTPTGFDGDLRRDRARSDPGSAQGLRDVAACRV